jgi:hypothetical protein
MAVTAHWIESVEEKAGTGLQKILRLRSDLVGFHKLPGRHTGEHLAHCFLFVTDRLNLTAKVSRKNHKITLLNHILDWMDNM